ncbi:MAG: phosphatase PAP2 family protein [candidate division KSB1 bacterium]|nr:phosphatase PAP2 family protein [candidate division KSB1 bacterium]MDQ7064020.1 phosphatase PAP2 family protein [candidate division KSB1 bacterium]
MKPMLLRLILIAVALTGLNADCSIAQPKRDKTIRAFKGLTLGAAAYVSGNIAREWAGPDRSLFSAPIGPDRFLRRVFHQPGKTTNWLDANGVYYLIFGGLVTTAVAPIIQSGRFDAFDLGYDVVAYSSGILLTGGITRIIKGMVSRPRPYAYFGTRPIPEDTSEAYRSFVSGHASIAFYMATFLHYRLRTLLDSASSTQRTATDVLLFGLAIYTAYSRMQIDQHYFTDVVAGALLGSAMARLTHNWFYDGGPPSSSNVAHIRPGLRFIQISIAF